MDHRDERDALHDEFARSWLPDSDRRPMTALRAPLAPAAIANERLASAHQVEVSHSGGSSRTGSDRGTSPTVTDEAGGVAPGSRRSPGRMSMPIGADPPERLDPVVHPLPSSAIRQRKDESFSGFPECGEWRGHAGRRNLERQRDSREAAGSPLQWPENHSKPSLMSRFNPFESLHFRLDLTYVPIAGAREREGFPSR